MNTDGVEIHSFAGLFGTIPGTTVLYLVQVVQRPIFNSTVGGFLDPAGSLEVEHRSPTLRESSKPRTTRELGVSNACAKPILLLISSDA